MNVIGDYIKVWSVYNMIELGVEIYLSTRYTVGVTPIPPLYSMFYALVAGVPAKVIGWACECGVILKFDGKKFFCPECFKEYRKENKDNIIRVK